MVIDEANLGTVGKSKDVEKSIISGLYGLPSSNERGDTQRPEVKRQFINLRLATWLVTVRLSQSLIECKTSPFIIIMHVSSCLPSFLELHN